MQCHILLHFVLFIGFVVLEPFEDPCEVGDSECLQNNFQNIADIIASGVPELDIKPSDPMFVDQIEGELTFFKFELINSTVSGLKQCTLRNVSINEEVSKLRVVYDCPGIELEGNYKIVASLFFTTSRGDYDMKTERYIVTVDAVLDKVVGNEIDYLQLADYSVKCELLGALEMVIRRTDSTSIVLVNMANDYIKSNHRSVALGTQDAVWTEIIRAHFERINKYLITRPVEEIVLRQQVK